MLEEFLALLSSATWFYLLVLGTLGLTVGSFLNVVIFRVPVMLENYWQQQAREYLSIEPAHSSEDKPPRKFNLATPRSTCPCCETPIKARHNIPLLSYLLLQGRCAYCSAPITIRYPLIELLCAVVTTIVGYELGVTPYVLAALCLSWYLIALTFIDLDHMLLPDNMTLPLMWGGIALALTGLGPISLVDSVAGAMVGYLILWSVFWAFKLLTGKDGMGYGDFKLLAALGAWLGWQQLPLIILLSSVIGAIVGIAMISMARSRRGKPIPFGPYLAGAGWISLLWGEQLTRIYLSV